MKFTLKLIIYLLIVQYYDCEVGKRVKFKEFKERGLIKPGITNLFVKYEAPSQSI